MSATTGTSNSIEIGGKYWDAQHRVFDALESGENDLVVFRTGYGGGKTLFGSDWIIGEALRTPEGHYLILAPDRTKGGPATYKGFFERLPGENTVPDDADGSPENSPIVAGYHGTKHRVTFPNGAIIQLGGADVWSRFAGSEFNGIFADEVAHYDNTDLYDLHEILVTRQRTEQGPNVMLWCSTGNGYNQFYDITERRVNADGEPLAWADRMEVVVGSALDNPFLDEKDKMLAQFEGTSREAQALHGGFAAAQGLVYNSFSRHTHVIPESDAENLATEDALYGYDHGWGDPRVVVDVRRTPYGQYLVYDLFYRSETKYQAAVDWLVTNDKPRGTVYAEHEPEHQEAFRQAGYPCEQAIKSLDEGIPEVRRHLETGGEGRPGLLVSDRCSEAIQEFMSYKEEQVGKSTAVDHALDSLRYLIMGDNYTDSQGTFMATQYY